MKQYTIEEREWQAISQIISDDYENIIGFRAAIEAENNN